jgi:hypothetical protein
MAYRSPNYPFISYNGRYPNDSVHLSPDLQAAEEIRAIFRRYAAFMNGVIVTAVLFGSILESATGIRDLRDRWPELAVFSPSKTKPVPEDAAQKLRARVDEEISECIASQY